MATYNYPPPPTSANPNTYLQQQQQQRRTSNEQTMGTMYYPPPPTAANPNLYQQQQRRVSNESPAFHPPTMALAQAQAQVSYPPSPNPYPQQQRRVSNESPSLAFAYRPASPSRPGYGNFHAPPGGSPGGMPKAYSSRRKAPCNNAYAQTQTRPQATTQPDYNYSGEPNQPPPPTEPQQAATNKKKQRGWFGKLNKEPGVAEDQQRFLEQVQASTSSPQRNQNPSSSAVSSPAVDDDRTIAKILRKGNKKKMASSSAIVVAPSHQSSKLPKEVHPLKVDMKNERKAKMAGAATTGAIVGAVLTGPVWPVGAVAGAALGSGVAKVTARAGERRQQRKWEQQAFNAYVAKGEAGVQSESVAFA